MFALLLTVLELWSIKVILNSDLPFEQLYTDTLTHPYQMSIFHHHHQISRYFIISKLKQQLLSHRRQKIHKTLVPLQNLSLLSLDSINRIKNLETTLVISFNFLSWILPGLANTYTFFKLIFPVLTNKTYLIVKTDQDDYLIIENNLAVP